MSATFEQIQGCLLGTAVGDALGLPREGLTPKRAGKLYGQPPLTHQMLFGKRGLCSDDTDHTLMVARSLFLSQGDEDAFAEQLAKHLRGWLCRMPAGIGLGTLRACLKLCLGVSPKKSGVKSAGNGPAMRSALLGVLAPDQATMLAWVRASTRLTHTDPRAFEGAAIIAEAARMVVTHTPITPESLQKHLLPVATDSLLQQHMTWAIQAKDGQHPPSWLAEQMQQTKGISGFVNHTVPAALCCWWSNPKNYQQAVQSAIVLGGDTDTVAAITGALAGTECGVHGIPGLWIDGLAEWPCNVAWINQMAQALHEQSLEQPNTAPIPLPAWQPSKVLVRNLAFIAFLLPHIGKRVLRPF